LTSTKEVKMNKIGYIRNSRLIQENSVSVQSQLIKDFCKTHDIKLDKIIVDEGISGSGEKTTKRDGYNSVMEMIDNGEVNTLVVISISRWGRNLGEIYKSVQLMETKGVKFLSIKENIDTSSPYGRFTINLLSSLYEMELELIRDRVKDTLKVKKENGKVYSPTPFGFDRVGDDLVENKKEKRLLRKMLRLKENGNSYGDVSKYLTKNRHKTKNGGKWTRQNVYSVLKTFVKNEKITPILV
jgi:site-specific DNA recombinase